MKKKRFGLILSISNEFMKNLLGVEGARVECIQWNYLRNTFDVVLRQEELAPASWNYGDLELKETAEAEEYYHHCARTL